MKELMDTINAFFEACAAVLLWLNVLKLLKERELRGMHWAPVLLFVLWGFWNLAYYAYLEQWWSLGAGICVALANIAWLYLFFKVVIAPRMNRS